MQRGHLTSAAILGADSAAGCPPPGNNPRHAWLAALNVGLRRFRSLPGPPWIEIAAPPPGLVMGSGKSETPRLRIQREYAKSWATPLLDPEPAIPGLLEPPQPAARNAGPSNAAIAAVHLIRSGRRRPGPRGAPVWFSWSDALAISSLLCVVAVLGRCTLEPLTGT
jgi:hypothetical protein